MRSLTCWTAGLALALCALFTSSDSMAATAGREARSGAQDAKEKPAAGEAKQGTLESTTSKAIERTKPAAGPAPAPADTPGPSGPNARAIANRMAAAVQVHEVRFARLDAVIAIFQQQNETTKVERAQALKDREDKRYQAELAAFKAELGDESYKTVLASLRSAKKGAGDAPKAKPGEKPAPAERKKEGGQ